MRRFEIPEIQYLRGLRTRFSPAQLLQRNCDAEVNNAFKSAFEKTVELYDHPLDYATFGKWIRAQSFASALFEYIEPVCDRILIADYLVASVLASIYDFPDLRICANATSSILQHDRFDADGLLIVGSDVDLCDEGACVGKHFLPYDLWLSNDAHGGSLIRNLKVVQAALADQVTKVSIRIDPAVWTRREYYRQTEKRARAFGPPEIVAEGLLNPHFPKKATGTLTQYMRTCTDSKWLTWSYDIERLEVF